MGQGVTCDWRHAAVSQPVLDGTSLVGVPICSNGWLHHGGLHTNHHRFGHSISKHLMIEHLLSKAQISHHVIDLLAAQILQH